MVVMALEVRNPNLSEPRVSVNTQEMDSSLDYIRASTGKVSTLVLDKNRMKDYWGGAAKLPGIMQAIAIPYRLISYTYDCIKNRMAPSLEVRHCKLVADLIKIANTVGIALLYACKVGLTVGVSLAVILPLMLVTGLVVGVIESGVEGYRLYQQKQFLEKFHARTLMTVDNLKKHHGAIKQPADGLEMLAVLKKAIAKDGAISPERKNEFEQAIKQVEDQYGTEAFLDNISLALNKIERTLLIDSFKELEEKYFKLSSKEIDSIEAKTKEHFKDQEFKYHTTPSGSQMALEVGMAEDPNIQLLRHEVSEEHKGTLVYDVQYGLDLIAAEFEKKQLQLAGRVQPWLAHKIASSYQNLAQELQKAEEAPEQHLHTVEESKELLIRAGFNANVKADIHAFNLTLWLITMVSSVIGFVFSAAQLLPIMVFITSFVSTTVASIHIETCLNNEKSMETPDWSNLVPGWIKKFMKKEETQPVDLTRRNIVDISDHPASV